MTEDMKIVTFFPMHSIAHQSVYSKPGCVTVCMLYTNYNCQWIPYMMSITNLYVITRIL